MHGKYNVMLSTLTNFTALTDLVTCATSTQNILVSIHVAFKRIKPPGQDSYKKCIGNEPSDS
jgi:hypothetical protein